MKKLSLLFLGMVLAVSVLMASPFAASAETYDIEKNLDKPFKISLHLQDQKNSEGAWGSYITPVNVTLTNLEGVNSNVTYGESNATGTLYQYADVVISGTPTKAGVGSINLEYQDGAGNKASFQYSVNIKSAVTVRYLDEFGNLLADDVSLTGNLGESYVTDSKELDGWVIKSPPDNATGNYSEQRQTVNYVYERAAGANVVVKYTDTEGNEIATADIISGKLDDTFETTPKEIDGFELNEAPTNATGIFTDQEQQVTYVYEKVEPEDSTTPLETTSTDSTTETSTNTFAKAETTPSTEATENPTKTATENPTETATEPSTEPSLKASTEVANNNEIPAKEKTAETTLDSAKQPNDSSTVEPVKSGNSVINKENNLPKTGDSDGLATVLFGGFLVLLTAGLFLFSKKTSKR